MKLFVDREVKELEERLRLEALRWMDLVLNSNPIDSNYEMINKEYDKALLRWKEVYNILSLQHDRIVEKITDVGASAVKIGLSLGANLVLAVVVGRMEFVEGRLLPTWSRVNIPIGGPKV